MGDGKRAKQCCVSQPDQLGFSPTWEYECLCMCGVTLCDKTTSCIVSGRFCDVFSEHAAYVTRHLPEYSQKRTVAISLGKLPFAYVWRCAGHLPHGGFLPPVAWDAYDFWCLLLLLFCCSCSCCCYCCCRTCCSCSPAPPVWCCGLWLLLLLLIIFLCFCWTIKRNWGRCSYIFVSFGDHTGWGRFVS